MSGTYAATMYSYEWHVCASPMVPWTIPGSTMDIQVQSSFPPKRLDLGPDTCICTMSWKQTRARDIGLGI